MVFERSIRSPGAPIVTGKIFPFMSWTSIYELLMMSEFVMLKCSFSAARSIERCGAIGFVAVCLAYATLSWLL